MLTSSANQYLRPEYLSPLPTTLDANKSPLALLAKTCSSIGVDQPNSKLLADREKSKEHNSSSHHNSGSNGSSDRKRNGSSSVNSIVNGDDDNSSQSNTTSCNSSKLSFKPYEMTHKKSNNFNNNNNIGERNCDFSSDVVISSEKKSPIIKVNSSSPKISGTNARTSPMNGSSSGKNTPSMDRHSADRMSEHNNTSNKSKNESNSPKTSNSSTSASTSSPTPVNSSHSSTTTSSALSFTSLGLPDMRLTDGHKDSLNSLSNLYKTNPYSSNCCPINGMTATGHLSVDKTGAYPSIYPPLSYARMKTSNGGQAILPMCRDPYCTGNCQLKAMQNAALLASAAASCNPTSCPNGCNQCDHQRIMSSLAASAAYSQLNPALIPGLSQAYGASLSQSYGSALGQNYGSGLYSPLTPGLQRPQSNNVCNWIAGETHCGKRFANSEELLQHLRTHTSGNTESATSVPSLISPIGSAYSAAAAAASGHMQMHYSTAGTVPPPSLTTAAGLRRTYPTSLSPLSNRFHPYKPTVIPGLGAMPSVPSANPLANHLHNPSALSLYYPYGLYSGRIGPPVHQ